MVLSAQRALPHVLALFHGACPPSLPTSDASDALYRFKLLEWNADNKSCRRTSLGPTFGGPLTQLLPLVPERPPPPDDAPPVDPSLSTARAKAHALAAYACAERVVGLVKMYVCPGGRRNPRKPARRSSPQSARLPRHIKIYVFGRQRSSNHRAPSPINLSQLFSPLARACQAVGRQPGQGHGCGRAPGRRVGALHVPRRQPPRHRGREGRHGAATRQKTLPSYMK